jgi:hypothetical protein
MICVLLNTADSVTGYSGWDIDEAPQSTRRVASLESSDLQMLRRGRPWLPRISPVVEGSVVRLHPDLSAVILHAIV